MDAVLLAAGLGTRLRPHTLTTPKPLLPVQGRPILDWTLSALPKASLPGPVQTQRMMGLDTRKSAKRLLPRRMANANGFAKRPSQTLRAPSPHRPRPTGHPGGRDGAGALLGQEHDRQGSQPLRHPGQDRCDQHPAAHSVWRRGPERPELGVRGGHWASLRALAGMGLRERRRHGLPRTRGPAMTRF